jgi:hypothetical protein
MVLTWLPMAAQTSGGQDGAAVVVQGRVGVFNACDFFARNRMGGHKARESLAQAASRGCDNIAFGGAHIHQQGFGAEHIAQGFKAGLHGAHRHGQHDQVRTIHRVRHAAASLVYDPERQCALTSFFRGAVARDAADQPCLTRGQSKRTAHQAAANECQALKSRRTHSLTG